MNKKALKTLEFDKIAVKLAEKAVSPMGKELAEELEPLNDLAEIRTLQAETSEAVSLIIRKGSLPLGGVRDVRGPVRRAAVGGVLSIEELSAVGEFLYVCKKVRAYSKVELSGSYPLLGPRFDGVTALDALEKEIARCVVGPQELADDASPRLREIRRSILIANDRIREHLNGVIRSASYRNMLQDAVVTIRNGRYCVPIKMEYRAAFPGMVHDQSSTGATVFMEPMSVVQLNNRIKELAADEKDETEAILRALSKLVGDAGERLLDNSGILAELDFIFARAELSLSMKASEPDFNDAGWINIKKGRHPLLPAESVVPTDIYLGRNFRILLVTGPNTGGKTVSLKTVGLFALMGQAGLHIPAFDHSELSVFDEVFADIGDEQSIEQSLSTFSSHMSNIVRIVEETAVTNNALVLLDELGAGTDPTEGAALAVAVLEYLHERRIRAVVTTHYSELKVYALSTEGVENASCEFDVETLRPTYRLLTGIPGKSNAFAISRRLGLPEHIISQAQAILSQEAVRFEDVITDMETSLKTAEIEKARAEEYRKEAEAMKKEAEAQKQKLAGQREKLLAEAREEARGVLLAAKDDADRLLKDFQRQLRENARREETLQELRGAIRKLDDEIGASGRPNRPASPPPRPLQKGDKVYIHSLGQTGTVANPPDASGEALIRAGIMKIKIHASDLSLDESEDAWTSGPRGGLPVSVGGAAGRTAGQGKFGKSLTISPEIDLRGLMADEAREKAEKYLDDAYLAGMAQVTIIHGKGTGALRAAIQEMLRKNARVKGYRLGQFGEGESGVTIVTMNNE
ncbi:MAG: endonuclease MutS2 [Firmicutes bacterium]|nr:endonuclease MutS2 [Bacillota bacterium]